MNSSPAVVIGHHLDTGQANALADAAPRGIKFVSLLGPNSWQIPDEVRVIVTQPPEMFPGGGEASPQEPPGWPGSVQWVHLRSTGVDRYPKWIFRAPLVTTSAGVQSTSICEYVLGAMIAHEKRTPQTRVSSKAMWLDVRQHVQREPLGGLEGKVLGLLGFGAIGKAVAAKAQAFGMRVMACRRSNPSGAIEMGVEFLSMADVVSRADHLVVAMPLSSATHGIVNARLLSLSKIGQHLINVARGPIVDSNDLLSAIETNRVAAATLDVTEPEPLPDGHPFYSHPSITLTPHIAYSGPSTERESIRLFAENLQRFLNAMPLHQRYQP